jgi:predicted ATPase/signal transduction histidine kinase/DNA-binding response OmpR family regulator/tRNA A-37 threonylcarbamoyl transferase component Bud32
MEIKDYSIKNQLFKGKRFTIHRAIGEHRGTSYILKVLDKKTTPDSRIINTLKHEYHLLKQVDSQYVIKAVDWFEDNNYSVIVLEDTSGQSLKQEIKENGGPIPFEQFIPLALKITKGLAAVHSKNIIHKDINPSNIIRSPQTGELKIIDFNIATTYDIKVSYTGSPEKLQGTLPYISPEQTGRMNRWLDHRSDLYSLGVTFYEMLTGKLPFQHGAPMEIVYAHLARHPEPPHLLNNQVPVILSKIVMKLLAKNPEERYQSALGLKHDLEVLQKALPNLEPLANVHLGEKDFPGKLQIPGKLYGREKELEQLLNAYQRVSSGTKEMTLVTGYSGTGKTALVNEIHKPITKDRGYFINGKFDQLQRTVPYFAFIQSLNQFCQLLLTEKQEILAQWKERISHAVGKLGKVLTDIIPQLEPVIGKQPDVPGVGGEEAKKRFNYVFQQFFRAVSSQEHPLVLFIDDLQWADLASLNLIQVLMEDRLSSYLLFIGAYRDNEVSSTHPLITTLEEIQKQHIGVLTIPVKNLSIENVREWLGDTLKSGGDPGQKDVESLTRLIYQKTLGNAFFTIQFLENLYREHLLSFDFNQAQWTWDIAEIKKQNITDNVVDLLVRKIQTLPAEVQEVLKLASCIGNIFYVRTLAVISGKGNEEHLETLQTATAQHLVYPLETEGYKFVHDRIHQAAYTLIPPGDKKALHLKIGRLLLENFNVSPPGEVSAEGGQYIFDIVNHLNTSIDLIENEEKEIQLARLNLRAGQKARASAAYQLSSDYLQKAMGLLHPDCWQRHYKLTVSIYNEALQAAYLCGEYEDMNRFVEILLESAREEAEKAVAYEHILMSLLAQKQLPKAIEKVIELMNKLGIQIPHTCEWSTINALFEKNKQELKNLSNDQLKKLPPMTAVDKQVVLRLYLRSSTVMYFGNQALYSYMVNKMILFTLQYGITPETAYLFAEYGLLNSAQGEIDESYRFGKLSMDLLNQTDANDSIRGRTYLLIGMYIFCWKDTYRQVAELLLEGSHYSLNSGDWEIFSYLVPNYLVKLVFTDISLSQFRPKVAAALEQMIQIKQGVPSIWVKIIYIFINELIDNTVTANSTDPFADILTAEQQDFAGSIKYNRNFYQLLLSYILDDNEHILENIQGVEESWEAQKANVRFAEASFFTALARLRIAGEKIPETERGLYFEEVEEVLKKTKKWAEYGPEIHQHRYYLLKAELLRYGGKYDQIGELYDKAIQSANENRFLLEEALANELAAKFYMNDNRYKLAALYLMEARDCYHKWGAAAKVKHLEENYPKYLSMSIPGTRLGTGTISSAADTTSEFLDVTSIIKASQTLSGEVQLARLLEKMLHILIENAGAQKSMLIENIDDRLLIQAEGTVDGVSGILQGQPVEEAGKVPLAVINYVARGQKKLVFDNVSKDPNYSLDPYVQKHQPKSAVCFPILIKDRLSAIIYLENNLVEGAFTPARVEVLKTLSSQIAISMENARVYRDLDELNKSLEQKVAERTRELKEQSEKLEEMDKIKSRFFANISHEFRTPLTLIMGPLEQRLTQCTDKRQQEEVQMMLRSSRRLLGLINQLLDLSRLDHGRMKLQACRQDIIPFLKGVLATFASLALRKKLELTFQTEQKNITLYFDAEQLEKVVTNLLSNAMKFTPAGGKISVTAAAHPGTDERYPGGRLEITVSDTGTGIPPDRLPYIFDRFYQAGGLTGHEGRGTGIGLALAKELVKLHCGEISVQSTEGKGSEFFIRLPLGKAHLTTDQTAISDRDPIGEASDREISAKTFTYLENDEPAAEESEPGSAPPDITGKNIILVVEDNPDMRRYIRGPLEAGYTVVEAADGKQGLEKAGEIIPDLIVSDIMMPRLDGYQLCAALKKDIKTSHIPVILLTAKASEESIIEGLETGADDYITKPFNTKILLTRIKNLIDLRRGLQEKIQREMMLQPGEISVSSIDQEFIKELKKAIEINLSEMEFGVDELAKALYMGRSTLNRKTRALTGESTNRFIQSYRLKRAAQLLEAKFGNVTEVAFEVGFSSPAYFARRFKEKFHCQPSDFLAAKAQS